VECEELNKSFDHGVKLKVSFVRADERVSSAQRLGLAWFPVTDPRIKPEDRKEGSMWLPHLVIMIPRLHVILGLVPRI